LVRYTNQLGRWLGYEYEGDSIRLAAIIGLRTQRIEYDSAGRMQLYDNGQGGVTRFTYT